ncbi:hypothetical protein F4692_003901 [Nocardioides cavernae]|uniref:YfhO family protein n=1 Tax=Nocardioides cavernae TaxID=1921566 RepID=A0A7Y9H6E2_9ACTN|nr:hypothetical protein [Nocardioides cavernae]NYE38750.1 hypothetical protein [Nocardioides cavernae]
MGERVGDEGAQARPRLGHRLWPVAWSALLAVLLLGGALGPGYVLTYDMVWVPDLAMRGDFLGLGSSLPRAVPSDLVVALADEVVPGGLLQKLLLLGTLVLAGTGAWRLVPGPSLVASFAASTLYLWNPFVVERLGIGHWPLLMTYAALPWIHLSARRLPGDRRALAPLVLWLAFASLSPVGGLVAGLLAVTSVVCAGRPASRATAWTALAVVGLNAPWVAAGLLHGSAAVSDPAAVALFAAHGEGVLPPWAAALGLGGIWNADVVPTSRTTGVALASLALVLVTCALGLRSWLSLGRRSDRLALGVVAGIGFVVAVAGVVAGGLVGWLVAHVPGAGLVRDGTRFLALLAPVQAVLFGLGVARLVRAVPVRALALAAGTALAVSPLALMPDAAPALSGRLDAVDFPEEYAAARRALVASREDGHGGDLLTLPFTSYRRPSWNDDRRTLDPLGRYFPVDYLSSDTLVVSGREIAGEDPRAARVGRELDTLDGPALEDALAAEGVGWVVLDEEAADALVAQGVDGSAYGIGVDLGDARRIHAGQRLTLWEVGPPDGGAVVTGRLSGPQRAALALAWLLAAGTLGAALVDRLRVGWNTSRQMRRRA